MYKQKTHTDGKTNLFQNLTNTEFGWVLDIFCLKNSPIYLQKHTTNMREGKNLLTAFQQIISHNWQMDWTMSRWISYYTDCFYLNLHIFDTSSFFTMTAIKAKSTLNSIEKLHLQSRVLNFFIKHLFILNDILCPSSVPMVFELIDGPQYNYSWIPYNWTWRLLLVTPSYLRSNGNGGVCLGFLWWADLWEHSW